MKQNSMLSSPPTATDRPCSASSLNLNKSGESFASLRDRIKAYRQMQIQSAVKEKRQTVLWHRKERELWRVREGERRRLHIADTVDSMLLSSVMDSVFEVSRILDENFVDKNNFKHGEIHSNQEKHRADVVRDVHSSPLAFAHPPELTLSSMSRNRLLTLTETDGAAAPERFSSYSIGSASARHLLDIECNKDPADLHPNHALLCSPDSSRLFGTDRSTGKYSKRLQLSDDIIDRTSTLSSGNFLSRALSRRVLMNLESKEEHDSGRDFDFPAGLDDLGHFSALGALNSSVKPTADTESAASMDVPLADCMFVVGPSGDLVTSMIKNMNACAVDGLHDSTQTVSPMPSQYLSPSLLFITSKDPDVVTDVLPSFCFPNDIETLVRPAAVNHGDIAAPNFFALQLSGNKQNKYIIGMQFFRNFTDASNTFQLRTMYCVCLISSHPYFLFFFELFAKLLRMGCFDMTEPILAQVGAYPLPIELRCIEEIALKLMRQSAATSGGHLKYSFGFRGQKIEASLCNLDRFVRYESIFSPQEAIGVRTNYYILQWALPLLLSSIPVDQIVFILGCILTEMKVVVKCKDTGVLSACIWGLVSLLRPFHWVCPLIVVLPRSLHEYIESIVPIIVGIVTADESTLVGSTHSLGRTDDVGPAPGLLVVDINNRKTILDPSDVVLSHTLKIPDSSKLLIALKQPTENILRHLKSKRKRRASVGNQRRPRANSSASLRMTTPGQPLSGTSPASGQSPDEPRDGQLPTEDASPSRRNSGSSSAFDPLFRREESDQLLSEKEISSTNMLVEDIISFSDAVAAHMTIVANTAIQLCWDNQAQRRRQRRDLLNAPRERSASDTSLNSSDVSGSAMADALPPMKPFATTFTTPRKLGNATLSFLNKFKDTQLFWQYCQRENEEVALASSASTLVHATPASPARIAPGAALSQMQQQQPTLAGSAKNEKYKLKDASDALFVSILSGSVPLDSTSLNALCRRHEEHITDLHLEVDSIRRNRGGNSYFTTPGVRDDFFELESRLSCHGRCMGKADTDACSLLCVKLWEADALYSYRLHEARRIIRHRQLTESCANNKVVTSSGRVFEIPRIFPGKHKSELDTQYEARVRLIRGAKPAVPNRKSENTKKSSVFESYYRKKSALLMIRYRLVAAYKISNFMLACFQRMKYIQAITAVREIQHFWRSFKAGLPFQMQNTSKKNGVCMNLVPRSSKVVLYAEDPSQRPEDPFRSIPKLEFRSDSAPDLFETQGTDIVHNNDPVHVKLQSRASSFDVYTSKLQEAPPRDLFSFPRAPTGL